MALTLGMFLFLNEYHILEIYAYSCIHSIHSFLAGEDLQTTPSSSYIILQLILLTGCSPSRKIDLNYKKNMLNSLLRNVTHHILFGENEEPLQPGFNSTFEGLALVLASL